MCYKVNAEIKKAKEIFYKNKLSESDCDALRTWQGINEHTSRKTGRSFIKELRANAQKNRAKSANRGHSSKPNLLSFSVCNKVLMSL